MHLLPLLSSLLILPSVWANKEVFNDGWDSQVCSGMYSKHDWGGSIKPHIGLRLNEFGKDTVKNKKTSEDILVSYVIFEYKDIDSLGVDLGDGQKKYICDDAAINDLKVCDKKHKGNFIINLDVTNSTIMTSHLTKLGAADINYLVNKTGYYCISTYSLETINYKGVVNFQNAFGQLSASEIPKLPAYGILTLCYAIALALYAFQFFKKRNENQILPLQRYLLAMLGFLTFDTLVVWSYYDLVNRTKNPTLGFVKFYMFFLSILNACKVTFSFFLLLLIALGYGVVVLKLEKKVMFRCKLLAGAHFAATLFYLIATYGSNDSAVSMSSDDMTDADAGLLLGLIPLIPVSITLTLYYLAILVSIKKTTANLHQQRQVIKLQLYEYLFRIIFLSVILTFGGLIFSSFIYLSMSTTEMIENHWKGAYFIFDFWPSVVFYVVFMGVAWLWRPTETSYMLAVSQQLSTEETEGDGPAGYHQGHEFELDDLSLMSHSDEERRDSFELQASPAPKAEPPLEVPHPEGTASNTLFELGEDEDVDDRLKKLEPDKKSDIPEKKDD